MCGARIAGVVGVLLCGATLLLPRVAPAQGVFDMGALTNTLSMDAITQSERERAARQGATGRRAVQATPNLRFRVDPARRQAFLSRFIETTRATNQQGGAELEQFFRTQDVFSIAETWMRPYGLRINDVADATAVYLVSAWLATRGSDADPTPAQMRGVQQQVAQAMAATPAMARAGDSEKQEIADASVVQAALVSAMVSGAKGDATQLASVRDAAAAGARTSYGIDLMAVELSDAGLRPIRGR